MLLRVLIVINLFLWSCGSSDTTSRAIPDNSLPQPEYATSFKLTDNGALVLEPWPGATSPIQYDFSKKPQRVILTSTTHLPYMELLGEAQTIVGFPSTQYIYSEKIRQIGIKDIGSPESLNLEVMLDLSPDLIVAFDMGAESLSLDKINEAGIPVVYNSDFLESSALGRAEWIKFFGALFHKKDIADSIFNRVKTQYILLQSKVAGTEIKPTVFSGVMYGDTWFLPGGKNWGAQFIQDAGGSYIWSSNDDTGWLELSFESVLEKARSADYWIGVASFASLGELEGQDSRYALFEAFQTQKVFNYTKRVSPGGGFDFFESGYSRPDLVLSDYIKILHPDLMPEYETTYFERIP